MLEKKDNDSAIKSQYRSYPYPSPAEEGKSYPELANLASLLKIDLGYDFINKRVLDVGTGTGQRLLEFSKLFPKTICLGVDSSEQSIAVARVEQSRNKQHSVKFFVGDANELCAAENGQFDVVFCMGVLHHLADPTAMLIQLTQLLNPNGLLLFYVYGKYGSEERMRRKRILGNLHGEGAISEKIESAKALGMTDFPYGWEIRNRNDIDAMIVDAYINEYEVLYTLGSIAEMIPSGLFAGWLPYGFTLAKGGLLVESRLMYKSRLPLKRTAPELFLPTSTLCAVYQKLSKTQQLLLLEDWYLPGGYTILLYRDELIGQFKNTDRVKENTWTTDS